MNAFSQGVSPVAWSRRALGTLCTVIAGQSPSSSAYNDKGEGLPFYQGKKEFTDRFLGPPTTWTTQITKRAETNDILMSVRAPVGPINETQQSICIGRGLAAIRAGKEIDRHFLWYALSWLQPTISGTAGAVFPSISKDDIEALAIPLAPIAEQKRIVAILNQAFAALDRARANAELNRLAAGDIFEAVLARVDGKEEALGSLVQIRTGKLDANAAVENGQYPFFTCAREVYAIDNYAFDCEAILLAGNNAVGDFNVKHFRGKFNAYQRTYVITVADTERLLYRYLYYQLLRALKQLKESAVGAGTKFLKLGIINDLKISIPELAKQQETVAKLDALLEGTQRLDSLYACRIGDIDSLKSSLLDKAFTGHLS